MDPAQSQVSEMKHVTHHIIHDPYSIMPLAIGLASSTCLMIIFLISINCPGPHPFTFIAIMIPDSLILWLPMLILWPKWRWTNPILLSLAAIFFYCNTLYFRNFGDIMSTSTLALGNTIDKLIIRSAISSAKFSDILFLVPSIISAMSIATMRKSSCSNRLSWKLKCACIIACIFMAAICQHKLYRNTIGFARDRGIDIENISYAQRFQMFFDSETIVTEQIARHGITLGLITDYVFNFNELKPAPQEIINEISDWGIQNSACTLDDNHNRQIKNVIFIVVESLNSIAIEWNHNNRLAMPVLNALTLDSSSISFSSVIPQVGSGRSSDGQMMYLSGIYPSIRTPMPAISPDGPYPSIARIPTFSGNTIEMIPESETLWNHRRTSKGYGFKKLYSDIVKSDYSVSVDSVLLTIAADSILESEQPFFYFITPVGMHDPYDKFPIETWISDIAGLDYRDKIYLEACAAFDKALGTFLQRINNSSLKDNTLIIIASDHEARVSCLSPAMSDERIFFAMLNSGLKGFKCNEIVGQIDIFPTVIDALGLWNHTRWHGFGTSLLQNIPGFAIRHDRTIAGDSTSNKDLIDRQLRAIDVSQKWINATNKQLIMTSLGD